MHGSSFDRKNVDMRLLSYVLSLNSHGFCECMHALEEFLVQFNHNTCNYNNNNNKNSTEQNISKCQLVAYLQQQLQSLLVYYNEI